MARLLTAIFFTSAVSLVIWQIGGPVPALLINLLLSANRPHGLGVADSVIWHRVDG